MLAQLVRKRERSPGLTVALVGREQAGDENLSLRYLAAAVARAGHRAVIVPLSGPDSLPAAAKRIREIRPRVVGLSMPDSDITIDALAFVRYLRGGGYDGHITCGGPLATLVRGELLDSHPDIDSVIRHDGEVPLVALLDRLANDRAVEDIPGISTRAGDGPPALVADRTPLTTRPLHANPLPELLGVPTARLSTSRGCPGRCPYCGPAALQREAVREGRAQGLDRAELASAGVGGTRYRHFHDVAEEVAALHHEQGARFFQIIDENLLSGGEERARAWLEGLMGELRQRRVGKVAFCLQADPDTLTQPILDLLEALGVIRVSIGIEGLTTPQRRALGRVGDAKPHVVLLEELRRRGFVASFNTIIVHPKSTAAGIARELDEIGRIPPVHFDVLSMAVYPGTQAHHTLLREGRVTGGMLALRFEPGDIVVNRFRAALIRLRLEAVGRYGANIFAHDVAVNVALARRLGLPGYDAALAFELGATLAEQNRVRLQAFRHAFALAQTDLVDGERVQALSAIVLDLARALAPTVERLERIQQRLEGTRPGRFAHSNLMIGSSMATGFVLTLASATGCGGTVRDDTARAHTTVDAGPVTPNAPDSQAPLWDAPLIPLPPPETECHRSETAAVQASLSDANCRRCTSAEWGVTIDAKGNVIDVVSTDGRAIPEDVRKCYLAALAGQRFPCLSGEDVWYECVTLLR